MTERCYMTAEQIFHAGKLFDEYLKPNSEDPQIFHYEGGVSDKWIATQVGCKPEAIIRLRLRVRRRIEPKRPPKPNGAEDHSSEPTLDRLMALEARFQALWDWARRSGFKPPTVPPPLGEAT